MDIDRTISDLLTLPQRKEVKRMTALGYSKIEAVRKLLRLGVLVRKCPDLESDLSYGTRYALRNEIKF